MDGVIYCGSKLVDGANEFIERMIKSETKFLFLTNNSEQTPRDLKQKLEKKGIKGLGEHNFITSAMATAMFLRQQKEHATVYVVGGGGLINELYNVGFTISESNPDYVVVGKTATNFNFETLKTAVRLIRNGAKFIGTNPDMTDPTENGTEPACGTLLAAIEAASGKKPYIIGKPNSLMMMMAAKKLCVHPEESLMIGDRMDTDIVGGMEAGMKTCLVLSGVSKTEDIDDFPYRPDYVFDSVADIDPLKL
jgi:NagD protein